MYAIFEADNVQYKVEEGMAIRIDRKEFEKGTKVELPNVIFLSNGQKSIIGTPYIDEVSIEAEFMEEVKGEKLTVFKKKRRKGYSRKIGHRQKYTTLKINKINIAEGLLD